MQINVFIDYKNKTKYVSNSFDEYILGDVLAIEGTPYKVREVDRIEYFYNEVVLVTYTVEVADIAKEGVMI